MDVTTYLDRIAYRGALTPNADTLRALHLAHLQTIPFENLDIHLRRPILLDLEGLFQKIVVWRFVLRTEWSLRCAAAGARLSGHVSLGT